MPTEALFSPAQLKYPRLSLTGPHVGKVTARMKTTTLRRQRYKDGWYRVWIGGKVPAILVRLEAVEWGQDGLGIGETGRNLSSPSPYCLIGWKYLDAGQQQRLARAEGYPSVEQFERACALIRGGPDFIAGRVAYYLHRIVEWREGVDGER